MSRRCSDNTSRGLQPDSYLLQRLAILNKRFRLGLAVDSGCTVVPLPPYACDEPWQLIKQHISHLHGTNRPRLVRILDKYEQWANAQLSTVSWVHKVDQNPRLLGDPRSHIQKIFQLFDSSQSRNKQRSQLGAAWEPNMEGYSVQQFDPQERNISYPSFSPEHEDAIARSHDNMKSHTEVLDLTNDSHETDAEKVRSTSDRGANKRRMPVEGNQSVRPRKNARIKFASSSDCHAKEAGRSSVAALLSAPKPHDSFSTAATASRDDSFVDTPPTSFGSHGCKDNIVQVKQTADQASLRRQDQPYSNLADNVAVSRPPGVRQVQETGQGFSQDAIEYSQASSGFQGELVEEEHKILSRMAQLPPVTTTRSSQPTHTTKSLLSTMQSTSTSASSSIRMPSTAATTRSLPSQFDVTQPDGEIRHGINCDRGSEGALFKDGKSPFDIAKCTPGRLPLHFVHEATRMAILADKSSEAVCTALQSVQIQSWEAAWTEIEKHTDSSLAASRSSKMTWDTAEASPNSVVLSGKLELLKCVGGKLNMGFSLCHLKAPKKTSRLARKYGAHRIFTFSAPEVPSELHAQFICWLVCSRHDFLGREWEVFFVKESKDKAVRSDGGTPYTVYAFAIRGHGIAKEDELAREGLLKWVWNPKKNAPKQSALKLFSRMALALTDTQSGIEFKPWQIVRTSDARSSCPRKRNLLRDKIPERKESSDGQKLTLERRKMPTGHTMNDGAGRISFAAATIITDGLGLDEIPSAFQGRIGGAKGLWIVDYTGEKLPVDPEHPDRSTDIWIEITESQLKFKVPTSDKRQDKLHFTLDIHSWSDSLHEHRLNGTIIPILRDRGVPEQAFHELLSDELRRQQDNTRIAMESGGSAFQKWIYDSQKVGAERASTSEIKMAGGLPSSLAEGMLTLSMAGFEPLEHKILHKMTQKALEFHIGELLRKDAIDLPRSTYALMVPDPLDVLPAGHVHIGFSKPLKDPDSEKPIRRFDGVEALIARFPAYLPSDVRKIKLVFMPELAQYKDVVVFSTRTLQGEPGLAEMLSGGDFDGDKAFLCWEPKLVIPFQNSSLEYLKSAGDLARELEIGQDKVEALSFVGRGRSMTGLVLHGFLHNMKRSMLGTVASWYMAYCYKVNSIVKKTVIGQLLGLLVDAPKQGHVFGPENWQALCKKLGLPLNLPKPFYKDEGNHGENSRPTDHILDKLRIQRRKATEELRQWFESLAKDKSLLEYVRTCEYRYKDERARAMKMRADIRLSALEAVKKPKLRDASDREPVLWVGIEALRQELEDLHVWIQREIDRVKAREKQGALRGDTLNRHSEKRQETRHTVLIKARKRFEDIRPPAVAANIEPFKRFTEDILCDSSKQRTDLDKRNPSRPEGSAEWMRFKASALYCHHRQSQVPLQVAGIELCQMQAETLKEPWFPVRLSSLHILRPDGKIVQQKLQSMLPPAVNEDELPAGLPDHDDLFDDGISFAGTLDELFDD